MSLSRVIGLVPTRLACPWLIRLHRGQLYAQHACTRGEQHAGCNTHDRNVVFPTASSPSNNIEIVCGSMESFKT